MKSVEDFQAYVSLPLKKLVVTKLKVPFLNTENPIGEIEQFIMDEEKIEKILQSTKVFEESESNVELSEGVQVIVVPFV